MSADNGVYLLECADQIRVTEASAIENLWWDDKLGQEQETPIWEVVANYYRNAKSFQNKADALLYAHEVADKLWICEYGVSTIIKTEKTWEEILANC